MPHRCANPKCRFDYYSMRAVCPDPACLDESQAGCGCYYRFHEDGTVEKMPRPEVPPPENDDIAWLCCYCSMEYEMVGRGQLRVAPDPLAFICRWHFDQGEDSVSHEGG